MCVSLWTGHISKEMFSLSANKIFAASFMLFKVTALGVLKKNRKRVDLLGPGIIEKCLSLLFRISTLSFLWSNEVQESILLG